MASEYMADGIYRASGLETTLKDGSWVSDAGTYLVTGQAKLASIPGAQPGDVAFTAGYTHIWQLNTDGTTWVELPKTAANAAALAAAASATEAAASAATATAVKNSIPQDYTTLSNDMVDLKSAITLMGMVEIQKSAFSETGYGISLTDGSKIESATYSMTDYISVKKNDEVIYALYSNSSTNNSVIAFYEDESEASFVSGTTAICKNIKTVFVVPENGYIRLSTHNAHAAESYAYIYSDDHAQVKENIKNISLYMEKIDTETEARKKLVGDFLNITDKTEVSVITQTGAFRNPVIGTNIGQPYSTNSYVYTELTVNHIFYEITVTTSNSANYPYYIIGTDENGVINYLDGAGGTNEKKTFKGEIPSETTRLFVQSKVDVEQPYIVINWVTPESAFDEIKAITEELQKSILTNDEKTALTKVVQYNRANKYYNVLFITDTHINQYPTGEEYVESAARVAKTELLDSIIHGGDMITTYMYPDTEEERGMTWAEYINALLTWLPTFRKIDNIEIIKGNHDEGHSGESANNATKYQFSMLNHIPNAVYNANDPFGDYYYIDHTNEKVRQIVLDSFLGEKLDGKSQEGCSAEEVSWLENIAFNIPNDWHVVIFTHYYSSTNNSYNNVKSVIKNFNNNHSNQFIGIIMGHQHSHNYTNSDGYNEIMVMRSYKTASNYEGGYSLFTFDTDNRRIYETCIGFGTDYVYSWGEE